MMRRICTILLVIGACLSLFALAGCSCIADQAAEEIAEEVVGGATGSDVEIDEDGDSFTITTEGEDGEEITIQGGEGSTVPDAYPDDFPLYDGDIVSSGSLMSAEGSMVNVAVETDDDLDTIKAFFTDAFGDDGWTVLFTNEMSEGGATSITWTLEKDGRNAAVSVGEEEGMTVVNHTVLAEAQ